ncbi:MAG: hypothetical protein ACKKL5_00900 [Candidatus Komeilibacteria bacterium]
MENEPRHLSPLELAKSREQSALEEHAHLVKALEANPKDSELRANVDRAYDAWQEAKRQTAQLEGEK